MTTSLVNHVDVDRRDDDQSTKENVLANVVDVVVYMDTKDYFNDFRLVVESRLNYDGARIRWEDLNDSNRRVWQLFVHELRLNETQHRFTRRNNERYSINGYQMYDTYKRAYSYLRDNKRSLMDWSLLPFVTQWNWQAYADRYLTYNRHY